MASLYHRGLRLESLQLASVTVTKHRCRVKENRNDQGSRRVYSAQLKMMLVETWPHFGSPYMRERSIWGCVGSLMYGN